DVLVEDDPNAVLGGSGEESRNGEPEVLERPLGVAGALARHREDSAGLDGVRVVRREIPAAMREGGRELLDGVEGTTGERQRERLVERPTVDPLIKLRISGHYRGPRALECGGGFGPLSARRQDGAERVIRARERQRTARQSQTLDRRERDAREMLGIAEPVLCGENLHDEIERLQSEAIELAVLLEGPAERTARQRFGLGQTALLEEVFGQGALDEDALPRRRR